MYMTDFDTPPPEDWETDRDDEFRQRTRGSVVSYDGTVYSDPNNSVLRFTTVAQHMRFLHYKTGRPIHDLWDEYEEKVQD